MNSADKTDLVIILIHLQMHDHEYIELRYKIID